MLLQISAERAAARVTAHDVGQQTETVIAVAHPLSRFPCKMGLGIQAARYPAYSFLRKVLPENQFLL